MLVQHVLLMKSCTILTWKQVAGATSCAETGMYEVELTSSQGLMSDIPEPVVIRTVGATTTACRALPLRFCWKPSIA
jgi:hypothetical protein